MRIISFLSLVCVVSSCTKSASSTTSPKTAQGGQEVGAVETPSSTATPTENVVQGAVETEALAFFRAVQSGEPASVLPFLPVPEDCQYMTEEMAKEGVGIEKCRQGITGLRIGMAQWLPRAMEQFKDLRPTGVVTLTEIPHAPKWGYQVSIEIENSPPVDFIGALKFEKHYRFFVAMQKSALAPEADTTTADQGPVGETRPVQEELAAQFDQGGTEPLVDGTMHFGSIDMKVLVRQPKEGRPVVAKLRIGTGSPLTIGFRKGSYPDSVKVVGVKLPAFANERLVMVTLSLESGEDVYSREMVTALVFLGDAATKPKVLWQGEGSYKNLFGQCETLNVVSFVPYKGGKANVMRHREVIVNVAEEEDLMGDAVGCVAKPKSVKRIARVKIP